MSHAEIEVEFDRRLMIYDGIDPITHILTNHIHPNKRSARVIKQINVIGDPNKKLTRRKLYVFKKSK